MNIRISPGVNILICHPISRSPLGGGNILISTKLPMESSHEGSLNYVGDIERDIETCNKWENVLAFGSCAYVVSIFFHGDPNEMKLSVGFNTGMEDDG